ncbi:MAG: glycosyltransferase family 39 protein [Chryseolinea sp.]
MRYLASARDSLTTFSTRYYKDIRFWLIVLSIIRLYGITQPPLEFQHPWRQADGLMIARNFYENGPKILYPMVDTAGEKSGITGSEFPLLNYLMYLVSLVFGYQHWYGRLIVLIVSGFGSLYFYKSVRKFFDEPVAFNATIILTASYWFSYSRKTFPDCFSASLCLIALYFILEYLQTGKLPHLLLYLLSACLGCLSKISSTLILSVLILPVFSAAYPMQRKIWMLACSAIVLGCIGGWYFVWVPYLNETFGYGDHFTGGCPLLSMGWEEIRTNFPAILRRLFIIPTKYLGCLLFIASFIYVLYKKKWIVFLIFLIPYLCFLLIILKTGKSILMDQYYVLCSIPAFAFISGYTLSQIANKKVMWFILLAIAGESIGRQMNDHRPHKINTAFANLETIVDSVSNRTDLFVINSGPHCPTVMYFAHRKGWTVFPVKLQDRAYLDEVKAKGCKFVLISKRMYGDNYDIQLDLPQLFESDDFRIYSLK